MIDRIILESEGKFKRQCKSKSISKNRLFFQSFDAAAMKIEIKDMPMVFQMTNKTDIHTLLVLDRCRLLNGDAKIYVYK